MKRPLARTRLLAVLPLLGLPLLPAAAHAHSVDPCAGLSEWDLFVALEPDEPLVSIAELVERFGTQESVATELLERLQIDVSQEDLVAILERVDADPTTTEIDAAARPLFEGLAGLSTRLVLTELLLGKPQKMTGKIRDYVYVAQNGSGHLSVDVCINRSRFYHWDVEVPPNVFNAFPRSTDPQDYPDDPFPQVDLILPDMATDPTNYQSVWARNLRFKLHAKGEEIEVRNVYYRDLSNPDLVRLDDSHPYYTSKSESCVDLFTPNEPPATYGELVGSDYCLGRCVHPAIVNTGG